MQNCFMNTEQLAALRAVVDHGTFEAGARALHITPSAMSQRIRALEASVGSVLVVRSTPVEVSDAGAAVLRLARQFDLLERETLAGLPDRVGAADAGVLALRATINADSLQTWFRPVLAAAASWPDAVLRLELADQGQSDLAVARARSMVAVSSRGRAHHGCSVVPLGMMRYIAVAAPALVERHRSGGSASSPRAALESMPVVDYGPDDDLQNEYLRRFDLGPPARRALVPSSDAFLAAVEAGLGWAMVPELQIPAGTDLVRLDDGPGIDVPLYWHRWKMASPALDRFEDAVRAAASVLRPLR